MNTLLPNIGNLEQAKEMFKQQAINKLKNTLKKKFRDKVALSILKNPWFWIIIGILFAIFIVFFLIAAAVSTSQEVANETQISENILPPQIYFKNLENGITSDFGGRVHPVTGQLESFHSGIDIGVPTGTPVSSSFDGVVSIVSYPRNRDPQTTQNAGIYVVVQSNDPEVGMSSRYLHLSEAFVMPGQTVKKGEIIGLSGNTGLSTGPHLHFEMIPSGAEAIDPKPYILLMSKLTDKASQEAFRVIKNIKWSNVDSDVSSSMPYYESNKMLYVSNIYMETAAPVFNERGTVYIRNLTNGGISDVGTSNPEYEAPTTPDPGNTVAVPPDIGHLTHPFFIQYAAAAQREEQRSGVPASITLSQAALESGYGRAAICNNMFGIKANKGWKGPSCTTTTHEEVGGVKIEIQAKFRSYSSIDESFADHSDFLLQNSRYKTALSKKNPYEFANELQRAGYATDSQYANLLKSIMRSQNLPSLDMNRGIDETTGQPFNDVSFVGGGNGGSGSGLVDSITITFGIRQYYGQPATIMKTCTDLFGKSYTCYKDLKDPETGNSIINLVNYNRVADLDYGPSNISPPQIFMKDIPEAISVTVDSAGNDDLFVSRVEYIKGKY